MASVTLPTSPATVATTRGQPSPLGLSISDDLNLPLMIKDLSERIDIDLTKAQNLTGRIRDLRREHTQVTAELTTQSAAEPILVLKKFNFIANLFRKHAHKKALKEHRASISRLESRQAHLANRISNLTFERTNIRETISLNQLVLSSLRTQDRQQSARKLMASRVTVQASPPAEAPQATSPPGIGGRLAAAGSTAIWAVTETVKAPFRFIGSCFSSICGYNTPATQTAPQSTTPAVQAVESLPSAPSEAPESVLATSQPAAPVVAVTATASAASKSKKDELIEFMSAKMPNFKANPAFRKFMSTNVNIPDDATITTSGNKISIKLKPRKLTIDKEATVDKQTFTDLNRQPGTYTDRLHAIPGKVTRNTKPLDLSKEGDQIPIKKLSFFGSISKTIWNLIWSCYLYIKGEITMTIEDNAITFDKGSPALCKLGAPMGSITKIEFLPNPEHIKVGEDGLVKVSASVGEPDKYLLSDLTKLLGLYQPN